MKASTLRDGLDPVLSGDDLTGAALGCGVWLAVVVAAPVIVLLLAAVLVPFEVVFLAALALVLVLVRLAGIVPWTVVIVDATTGLTRTEKSRNLLRVIRRVQQVNGDRRVPVRFSGP